ncbi:MAG: hypothetical protein V1875_08125 [Candidatus Altiarchaeota archaeon]
MEPDKSLEKMLYIVAVCALFAYMYFNLNDMRAQKVYEIGSAADGSFSASDLILQAKVAAGGESGYAICQPSPSGDIRRCGPGDWSYVGATAKKMAGTLRKCVWAHPISGKTIRITFEDANVGDSIGGFYGLSDGSELDNPGTVNFTMSVGGKTVFDGAAAYAGAQEFTVDTEPGRQTVEFKVFTDNDRRRYFCFDASSSG